MRREAVEVRRIARKSINNGERIGKILIIMLRAKSQYQAHQMVEDTYF
jgi:hypothetical protein